MQGTSFICEHCHERIEDCNSPVIVYIVAGIAPLHPAAQANGVDLTLMPLPAVVREVLAHPHNRMDFCAGCFAEKLGLPLLDEKGEHVAASHEAKVHLDGAAG